MNSQKIQQSTNNIQNELSEGLKNSEVDVAIENDSISEDNSLDLQIDIDPNTIHLNLAHCCLDQFGRCIPCPPPPR
ncbi:hypothetical protein [Nostoc sp. DedQUE09]|uniref:hypothetical protein n=1 Tax=Nostoc sp. DedQUE09 TaxID=3075394 RepID=UPI002AD31794|nr:hypothetical protein [Nostoc sp. DedQUE09]MDZ7949584.1 hypothetical protein [Nostoc sp. DedQUE09]